MALAAKAKTCNDAMDAYIATLKDYYDGLDYGDEVMISLPQQTESYVTTGIPATPGDPSFGTEDSQNTMNIIKFQCKGDKDVGSGVAAYQWVINGIYLPYFCMVYKFTDALGNLV